MTTLLRQGAVLLMLVGGVGPAAAQNDQSGSSGAAVTHAAGASDGETTPGTNPSPAEPIPGATGQTTPAKFSAENAAKDAIPLTVNDLGLSDADKRAIVQALAQDRAPASTTGSASGNAVTPPQPGSSLSEFFELRDFPAALTDQLPALKNHKYVALADRVLLVNPSSRIVNAEIRK